MEPNSGAGTATSAWDSSAATTTRTVISLKSMIDGVIDESLGLMKSSIEQMVQDAMAKKCGNEVV